MCPFYVRARREKKIALLYISEAVSGSTSGTAGSSSLFLGSWGGKPCHQSLVKGNFLGCDWLIGINNDIDLEVKCIIGFPPIAHSHDVFQDGIVKLPLPLLFKERMH
jgi:hypothetical protein